MARFPVVLLLLSLLSFPIALCGQESLAPDTVTVPAGTLTLRGLLWRPTGAGPFPAILFNHGSYAADDTLPTAASLTLGPVFAQHGYVFLYLMRRGVGLSSSQGPADGDLMNRAFVSGGQPARNRIQLELLEGEAFKEASAALAVLRARPEVDPGRIGVVGHSFGGSLTVLMTGRKSGLRAAVVFSGGGYSWARSPALRAHLRAAVAATAVPLLFIHAANDYSTAPGTELARALRQLQKPGRVEIYPPFGQTPRDGHNVLYGSVGTWEADVFRFLDPYLRPDVTGP